MFNIFIDHIAEETPGEVCQPIDIARCQTVGYNSTFFPNQISQSQTEAADKLSKYIPVSYDECSESFMTFICSLHFPPCYNESTKYVKPCRHLCEEAKRGCESVMSKYGYNWDGDLSCDNFQDGECFSPEVKGKLHIPMSIHL